jgi:hypothetical protein
MKFEKKRARFSVRLCNWPFFKPTYFRCGNFGQFYGFGLCITFPLRYHLDFVFNEGYDEGFRSAYGAARPVPENIGPKKGWIR